MFLAGGILAYMFSGKLGPLKGIAKIAGIGAAALGAADILGIFSISQVPVIGSFNTNTIYPSYYGAWQRPYGY